MIPRGDRIQVLSLVDHTSIADEDQAVEPEPPAQVGDGLADGGVVHFVAGPDVMAIGQPATITTATITWTLCALAIAAAAVLGKAGLPVPSKSVLVMS